MSDNEIEELQNDVAELIDRATKAEDANKRIERDLSQIKAAIADVQRLVPTR